MSPGRQPASQRALRGGPQARREPSGAVEIGLATYLPGQCQATVRALKPGPGLTLIGPED
jgi:hypothetical protein